VNNPTGAVDISNSATITSGVTTATAGDTTSVTPPIIPTDAPPAGAPETSPALPTLTPTPTQSVAGNSEAVSGLPNTGGGPPQPTYWIVEPRQ
jgi:hypothetical protein